MKLKGPGDRDWETINAPIAAAQADLKIGCAIISDTLLIFLLIFLNVPLRFLDNPCLLSLSGFQNKRVLSFF